MQNVVQDIPVFTEITEDALFEKVRQIFEYSLHNEAISRFRRMMVREQFRSPELAALAPTSENAPSTSTSMSTSN